MLVYLDTNVFGRPFDDCSQPRINIEAQASLAILDMIEQKKLSCLGSDILKLEVSRSPMPKRNRMTSLVSLCSEHISETNDIKNLAIKIYKRSKIEVRDALHIATACIGKADYFITCDDEIIRQAEIIGKELREFGFYIKITNVINFIEEVEK